MNSYLLPAFEENLLDFEIVSAKTAGVFWLGRTATEVDISPKQFQESYSFFSAQSDYYAKNLVNAEVKIKAKIERYGGYGIAKNGGGARSANIGDFQVKGIGVNYLLGKGSAAWYSTGALSIIDAVQETIYSLLVDKITPAGAVKIRGIIKTGSDAAYFARNLELNDIVPCWGALLVRDTCIRPGHFLRAMYFEPKEEFKGAVSSDVVRMRKVMKRLKFTLGDNRRIALLLSDFALKNARQFGFCKAARLSHGALTPSNLSMDGRWLDLPTCSLMDSGKNYINALDQSSAFGEYEVVKQILIEIAYNFSKYANENINVAPILRMYDQAYSFFFHKYCSYILGIPTELWPDQGESASCDYVVLVINKLITHDSKPISTVKPSALNEDDPLLLLLEFLYCGSIHSQSKTSSEWLLYYGVDSVLLKKSFTNVLSHCYDYQECNWSYNSYVRALAICSLRRFYFAVYFYRDRLYAKLKSGLFASDLSELEGVLNLSAHIIEWAFEDIDFNSFSLILRLEGDSWQYDPAINEYSRTLATKRTLFADEKAFCSDALSTFDCSYNDEIIIQYIRKVSFFMLSLSQRKN